jgi:hypothetical protein
VFLERADGPVDSARLPVERDQAEREARLRPHDLGADGALGRLVAFAGDDVDSAHVVEAAGLLRRPLDAVARVPQANGAMSLTGSMLFRCPSSPTRL